MPVSVDRRDPAPAEPLLPSQRIAASPPDLSPGASVKAAKERVGRRSRGAPFGSRVGPNVGARIERTCPRSPVPIFVLDSALPFSKTKTSKNTMLECETSLRSMILEGICDRGSALLHQACISRYGFLWHSPRSAKWKTAEFLEEDECKKSFPQIGHPAIGGFKNERLRQSCQSVVGVLRRANRRKTRFSRRKHNNRSTRMSEYPNTKF
jgi:hypothetical protein